MVEGGAGEGEVLGCLQVGAGPDEGVVSGASIAERAAEGVGHGFGSFSLGLAGGSAWADRDRHECGGDHGTVDRAQRGPEDSGVVRHENGLPSTLDLVSGGGGRHGRSD